MEQETLNSLTVKEKREKALSVRLPNSVVEKLKLISGEFSRSQSEIIEFLINDFWERNSSLPNERKNEEQ